MTRLRYLFRPVRAANAKPPLTLLTANQCIRVKVVFLADDGNRLLVTRCSDSRLLGRSRSAPANAPAKLFVPGQPNARRPAPPRLLTLVNCLGSTSSWPSA